MMLLRSLAAMLATAVLGCACASGSAPAAPEVAQPAAAADSWRVTLQVTGGFAGLSQTIAATSSTDMLVVNDARRGTEQTVRISSEEHRALAASVLSRATPADIDRRSSSCRDCVQFAMTITGTDARVRNVRYDTLSMDGSPDARLIEHIVEMGRSRSAESAR